MYIPIVFKFLLIIAAFNYSMIHILDVDPILWITKNKSVIFGIVVLFVVALYMFNRDYYLPFLGATIIPVKEKEIVGNQTEVKLSGLTPNTKIIYWGANPSDKTFEDPMQAYSGYGNSGIATTDASGNVTIKVICPSDYKIGKFGMTKTLPKHIHYRIESQKYPGMFSNVKTQTLNC